MVKDYIPPDGVCRGSSILIELLLDEPDKGVKEELRVLNRDHLPCYSTLYQTRRATGLPAEVKETIRWQFRDQVDPHLYMFAPRKRQAGGGLLVIDQGMLPVKLHRPANLRIRSW